MAIVQDILDATSLAIGRNPQITWIDKPAEMLYPPGTGVSAANIGVAVPKAVSAYVILSPRIAVGRKSGLLTLVRSTFLSAYTYTVTVDGTPYTSAGQATAMAAVASLVLQINTAAVGNVRALAVASTTDGILDTVWVFETDVNGGAAANLVVNLASTGGGSTIEGYVDPVSFKARLWVQMASPAQLPLGVPWTVPQNGDLGAVPAQGLTERYNVAGYQRLYVEVYDVVKDAGDGAGVAARPYVVIAPAAQES